MSDELQPVVVNLNVNNEESMNESFIQAFGDIVKSFVGYMFKDAPWARVCPSALAWKKLVSPPLHHRQKLWERPHRSLHLVMRSQKRKNTWKPSSSTVLMIRAPLQLMQS